MFFVFLQIVHSARRIVHEKEDVEFHHDREDQEESVHDQTQNSDLPVEHETVKGRDKVEADHARDYGEVAVHQGFGHYRDVLARDKRLDCPGQPQTE